MKFLKKYSYIIRSFISLIAFLFLLFPFFRYEVLGQTLYEFEGIELIFGYENLKETVLSFNIVGFVMFITLLASIVSPMFYSYSKKKGLFVEIGCLLITIAIYFLLPTTVSHVEEVNDNIFKTNNLFYIGAAALLISFALCVYEIIKIIKEKKTYEETN